MSATVNQFLQQIKDRCQAKAAEMAKLELSAWDANHEQQLKKHFGFNDKSLSRRKKQLNAATK